MLKPRPGAGEINRRDIAHEEHGVRIAHIDEPGEAEAAGLGNIDRARILNHPRDGDFRPAEPWRAHVDAKNEFALATAFEDAGFRLHVKEIGRASAHQLIGDATRAIAASAGFAAVIVENRHENIDFVKPRDSYHDEIQSTGF